MKKILDACCGSRMFWFDRTNQDVLFADNRELETTLCDGRALLVKPDIKMDFREMPFPDNTFKMRGFMQAPLVYSKGQIDGWWDELSTNLYATMTTVAGMVLREHFGFGKQRLLKFRNEFQNMTKSALDLDYLGSHYVTLEDYANELNEQFDMGIDVSRVRNCQGSYDDTDAKFRTVKLDKVLEELKAGGFEDAAQFLEKKVA